MVPLEYDFQAINYHQIHQKVVEFLVVQTRTWYQFILEACARKCQTNKELCEKHGVLKISLLGRESVHHWSLGVPFFLNRDPRPYIAKNSVHKGSPRVSTKFVSIYIYTIFIMRVHSNGTSMRVCTHAGEYINLSKLGSGCVLYTWVWFSIAILRHANKSGIAKLFLQFQLRAQLRPVAASMRGRLYRPWLI